MNHDAKGGTELLYDALERHVDISGVNVIPSNCFPELLVEGKPNILWQHQDSDQPPVQMIRDQRLTNNYASLVFVSGWQYEQFRKMNIPLDRSTVIRNAIEPIEYKPKPSGKKKLIWASMPYRGLDIALDVFEMLGRDDVELEVYSSTSIYGKKFDAAVGDQFRHIFERASSMPGVNYHGQASNEEVRAAMQEAHILAYPTNFRETSCLVMMEAAAAGCQIVSTMYGALPETSGGFGTLVPLTSSMEKFKADHVEALNYAIDNRDEDDMKRQSDYFNTVYSWERRAPEWERLIDKLIK